MNCSEERGNNAAGRQVVGQGKGELFLKAVLSREESVENKSAKRSVAVSLNVILFADPRGVWIPGSLGCKVPPLWESWASKVLAMEGSYSSPNAKS